MVGVPEQVEAGAAADFDEGERPAAAELVRDAEGRCERAASLDDVGLDEARLDEGADVVLMREAEVAEEAEGVGVGRAEGGCDVGVVVGERIPDAGEEQVVDGGEEQVRAGLAGARNRGHRQQVDVGGDGLADLRVERGAGGGELDLGVAAEKIGQAIEALSVGRGRHAAEVYVGGAVRRIERCKHEVERTASLARGRFAGAVEAAGVDSSLRSE